MDILPQFMAYAGDFERTLADDDWSRLERYFADDAVYEVGPPLACRLAGRAAIFAGIRKSLNGLDRKFTRRDVAVTSGPDISGDEMRLGWQVTYFKDGQPPYVLRGRSTVRYAGDAIVYLADAYDPAVTDELAAYQRQTGIALDPSYT